MRLLFTFFVLLFSICEAQSYKDRVDALCDTSLYGRGYYESGDSLAAKFIENEYYKIGLEPFKNGFLQPFNFNVNAFPEPALVKLNERPFLVGKDFIPDPGSKSVTGKFDVFVFNMNTLHNKKRLKELDKKDFSKTVIVIDSKGFDPKKNKSSKSPEELVRMIRSGVFNNPATIVITERLTFGVSTFQSQPVLYFTDNTTFRSGDSIEIDVKSTFMENYLSYNVTGYVKGAQYPDSFLFISAHYDHLGSIGGKAIFRGANDNASGVALLLELADKIQKKPLPCSVVFVAFAGEEAGLIGSDFFVNNLPVNPEKCGFAINFDIVGTGSEGIMVVNAVELSTPFGKLLEVNKSTGNIEPVKSRRQAPISDHYRFFEAGIPAFYIYTLGGSKAYHDIYDVPSNLTYDVFEKLTDLVYKFYSGTIN